MRAIIVNSTQILLDNSPENVDKLQLDNFEWTFLCSKQSETKIDDDKVVGSISSEISAN